MTRPAVTGRERNSARSDPIGRRQEPELPAPEDRVGPRRSIPRPHRRRPLATPPEGGEGGAGRHETWIDPALLALAQQTEDSGARMSQRPQRRNPSAAGRRTPVHRLACYPGTDFGCPGNRLVGRRDGRRLDREARAVTSRCGSSGSGGCLARGDGLSPIGTRARSVPRRNGSQVSGSDFVFKCRRALELPATTLCRPPHRGGRLGLAVRRRPDRSVRFEPAYPGQEGLCHPSGWTRPPFRVRHCGLRRRSGPRPFTKAWSIRPRWRLLQSVIFPRAAVFQCRTVFVQGVVSPSAVVSPRGVVSPRAVGSPAPWLSRAVVSADVVSSAGRGLSPRHGLSARRGLSPRRGLSAGTWSLPAPWALRGTWSLCAPWALHGAWSARSTRPRGDDPEASDLDLCEGAGCPRGSRPSTSGP